MFCECLTFAIKFQFKPHLGFGEVGGPPRVPPNAEILAEVQVISMEHTDEPMDFMNHAELSQLPYADVCKKPKGAKILENCLKFLGLEIRSKQIGAGKVTV